MTEMELATSAQCVSITLFRFVSAATWSCVCSSSSMLSRPAALPKGTPDIGTGPATLMVPGSDQARSERVRRKYHTARKVVPRSCCEARRQITPFEPGSQE